MIRQLPADVQSYLRSGVAITSVTQCVEELFLNAVDAGANCVAVRVDLDAFKVQVVDNGSGIPEDQLALVGERYSTSKCHLLTDLDKLCYYGYRGEALASMRDSCGILEITTRTDTMSRTYCKMFQNGRALNVTESSKPRPSVGTTVTVHDLFSNFPVRRKSTNTGLELEKIRHRLEGLALLKPNVSVSLRNDLTGTVILQTHKCSSTLKTFSSLFGADKARALVEVNGSQGQFTVEGFIGKSAHPKKDLQFVYINRRLVLKTKIHKCVNQAMAKSVIFKRGYGQNVNTPELAARQSASTSPTKFLDKHPIYILDIKCPLTDYDITFDPAKTLVEFKNWDNLLQCITDVVNRFLKKENLSSSPEPSVDSAEVEGSSKAGTELDTDVAAGRISPSMLTGTLTSKKVKRQVADTASSVTDMFKTPHTVSLEEWKAKHQENKHHIFNGKDTHLANSSTENSEFNTTVESDEHTSADVSSVTNASADSSDMVTQTSASEFQSCETTNNSIGTIQNDKEMKVSLITKASDIQVLEKTVVMKPSLGTSEKQDQPSSIESSEPQSSLSLYRKAVGKPSLAVSNVSVESSLKKVSSFLDHSKYSLSSLWKFRKQSEHNRKMANTSQCGEDSSRDSNDSEPSNDIQPVSLKALQKISAEFKATRNHMTAEGDHTPSGKNLVNVQSDRRKADVGSAITGETKQCDRGLSSTRERRKRLNEIQDPDRTTAAKLSKLVQEKTASVTIDPDPTTRFNVKSNVAERFLQSYQYQGQGQSDIPRNTATYCRPTLSNVTTTSKTSHESMDLDVTNNERIMNSQCFLPSNRWLRGLAEQSIKENVEQQPLLPITSISGTSGVVEDAAYQTDQNICAGFQQTRVTEVSSEADKQVINRENVQMSTDLEPDEQSVNNDEKDTYMYAACPLSIYHTENVSCGQFGDGDSQQGGSISGSEQFALGTQAFSPNILSQASLDHGMTKISLSQGFTPEAASDVLDEKESNVCKTPQSEGFSPHLDFSMRTCDKAELISEEIGMVPSSDEGGKQDEVLAIDSHDRQESNDKNTITIHSVSGSTRSEQNVTGSSQNSPDTFDATVKVDSNICRKLPVVSQFSVGCTKFQSSVSSANIVSEDVTVTQLLERATAFRPELLAYSKATSSSDKFTFSDIFSPSQKLAASLCDRCHDGSISPDHINASQDLPSKMINHQTNTENDTPNLSWNTTWSSVNDNETADTQKDVPELDDTYDIADTQTELIKGVTHTDHTGGRQHTDYGKNNNIDKRGNNLKPRDVIEDITRRSENETDDSRQTRKDTEALDTEHENRTTQRTEGCQAPMITSSTATAEGQGPWVEMTDPATGKQLFVHSKSGASVFGTSFKGKPAQEPTPVRLERLFRAPGSVRIKPGTSRTAGVTPGSSSIAGMTPGTSSSVAGMVEEFLERDEEDAEVKWRSPRDKQHTDTEERTSMETLFEEWTNPVLDCPNKEVTSAEVSGMPSRAVVNAYKSMHTFTFTKDMLENVQVIGQLDKKFIACLITTNKENAGDADLLAVIDQHAAHERIRLEMLTEEAYVDCDRKGGQLCLYPVTPPKVMTFTEDEVRVMVTYSEEFKRIGITFKKDQQSRMIMHVQSVPECLVIKGDPDGKRKTDFIYWNTIEALIKDHVELLQSTSGARGRFPKVIHRILCSLACHGAIKFGDRLKLGECEALIRDLSQCDLPFQCAHGRPSVMPVLQLQQLATRLPQQKQKKPQLYKLTQAMQTGKDTQ